MELSDWAKKLADLKKQEIEQKRLGDEKDLSDRKMLEEHAGSMWMDVRKAVRIHIEELNKQMSRNYMTMDDGGGSGDYSFTIHIGGRSEIVEFEKRTTKIIHHGGTSYQLQVIRGNGVVWKDDSGIERQASDIAQTIVERVFRMS